MHAAPAESKRQMFKILRENWDDIRPELENIHAEREKVFDLMKQEKFDGEALQVADGVDPTLVKILADAQTSGGLLFAVSADQADALLALLGEHGALCAVRIGQVRDRGAATLQIF